LSFPYQCPPVAIAIKATLGISVKVRAVRFVTENGVWGVGKEKNRTHAWYKPRHLCMKKRKKCISRRIALIYTTSMIETPAFIYGVPYTPHPNPYTLFTSEGDRAMKSINS